MKKKELKQQLAELKAHHDKHIKIMANEIAELRLGSECAKRHIDHTEQALRGAERTAFNAQRDEDTNARFIAKVLRS